MADISPMKPGYFPLPLLVDGELETEGLTVRRSEICTGCAHQECRGDRDAGGVRLCSEGVNYVRPTSTTLVRGIFVDGYEPSAQGPRQPVRVYKVNRRKAARLVRLEELGELCAALRALASERQLAAQTVSEAAVHAEIVAVSGEAWVRKLVAENAGRLSSTLIHDILQLVATIFQNADYILDARYGSTLKALQRQVPPQRPLSASDAARVWKKEKAIFFTAELLKSRLDAAYELTKGSDSASERWMMLSPHQMFLKFIRIYEAIGEDDGVDLRVTGQSLAKCFAPEGRFALPFAAVLDNALKYSPERTPITIDFYEDADEVAVSVESVGPRIHDHERDLIFSPHYRGIAAAASSVGGSGIGLWQAKRALEGWGAISVEQQATSDGGGRFLTTFEIRIARDHRRRPLR